MNQTGYISFLILIAFAVFVTAKGELGTYVSFFTTNGNDPVVLPETSSGTSTGSTSSSASPVASATSAIQNAGTIASIASIFA